MADSSSEIAAWLLPTSQTSRPAKPSTGLTTAVPTLATNSRRSVEIGADVRWWAEVGEAQGDELLVHRPYSFGAVDHASTGFLGEVEQVGRVEVALVDGRIDAQVHQVERGEVDTSVPSSSNQV